MALVPGWPAHELLQLPQLVIFWMSLMTLASAGIAGFGVGAGDVLELVPEPLDEVELEVELVSWGPPPHPARISANKQRPMPCNRIIRPPGDEAAQRNSHRR